MSDIKLLEGAAKAAGFNLVRYTWFKGSNFEHVGLTWKAGTEEWNPLEDNADAFELLVLMGYTICIDDAINFVGIYAGEPGGKYDVAEEFAGDKYAATRRAIVRAAAEIGRAAMARTTPEGE